MSQRNPRRGRPPQSDGPSTRDRILDAALEAFAESGYDGATVRDIAAKVGVSDPALYAHFAGKKAIFEALMDEAGPGVLGSVSGGDRLKDMPARIAIPDAFNAIVASWTSQRARAFTSVMLRLGPEGIGGSLREVAKQLHPIFSTWQARGELRSDIPVDVAVWQVIGPISGLRLAYLHAASSQRDVSLAISLAEAHLAHIAETLTTTEGVAR